jgi:hypothetical protein
MLRIRSYLARPQLSWGVMPQHTSWRCHHEVRMSFLAFLVASGLGAATLVWQMWQQRPRRAAIAVFVVAAAAVVFWLVTVPRVPGSQGYLFGAAATLLLAMLLPGGAGAAFAYSSRSRRGLVGGLLLMLALWLALASVGLFSVCQLDPRCDL